MKSNLNKYSSLKSELRYYEVKTREYNLTGQDALIRRGCEMDIQQCVFVTGVDHSGNIVPLQIFSHRPKVYRKILGSLAGALRYMSEGIPISKDSEIGDTFSLVLRTMNESTSLLSFTHRTFWVHRPIAFWVCQNPNLAKVCVVEVCP